MSISVEQFIKSLTDAGLVSSDEIRALQAGLPEEKRLNFSAEDIARELIERRRLTQYQAAAALDGRLDALVYGNYIVTDKLGHGGMGVVYKAIHQRMRQVVALKVMSRAALESPVAVERFRREVEAAARLDHPNIVAAYNADEYRGAYFLVVEFVDGNDLGRVVKEHGPLPVGEAVKYILQAARGLAHAHAAGVVHRDIKPSNLIRDRQGTIKILDMGLVRLDDAPGSGASDATSLTEAGSILGTMDYMSPEQAENARLADHRSDIYSLGCTLCYLLTGQPPFAGASLMEKLLAHRETPIPSLRSSRPDVPESVDAVFRRMLAKRVDERHPSMEAVIRDLEAVVSERHAPPIVGSGGPPASPDSILTAFLARASSNSANGPTDDCRPTEVSTAETSSAPISRMRNSLMPGSAGWKGALGVGIVALVVVGALALWSRSGHHTVDTSPFDQHPRNSAENTAPDGQPATAVVPPAENAGGPAIFRNRTRPLRGQRMGWSALVSNPAPVTGVWNWTIETRSSRGEATAIAYSPDGSLLAAGSDDGIIRVFEADTRRLIRCLVGVGGQILSLSWAPDGKHLASSGGGPSILIWDAKSGIWLATIEGHTANVRCVAWSPKGDLLLSGGDAPDHAIRLWQVATGEKVSELQHHRGTITSLEWSSDGKHFACGSADGTVSVWKRNEDQPFCILEQTTEVLAQHAWMPNSTTLAIPGRQAAVEIWDVARDQKLQTLPVKGRICGIAWAHHGREIAIAALDVVELWDVASVSRRRSLAPSRNVQRVAFSPTDTLLVSGDLTGLLFWDAVEGSLEQRLPGQSQFFQSLVWSSDGKTLVAGNPFGINGPTLWDVQTGSLIRNIAEKEDTRAISPDGTLLLTRAGDVEVLRESRSGKTLGTLRGNTGGIGGAAWSPDAKWLATAGTDKTIRIWPSGDLKELPPLGAHPEVPVAVAWSPDGRKLISAGGATLQVWDVEQRMPLQALQTAPGLLAVIWTNDGLSLATLHTDNRVRVWDARTGTQTFEFESKASGMWSLVAFESRGVAASGPELPFKRWDGDPNRLPQTTNTLWGWGVFSPNGRRIAFAGWNSVPICDPDHSETQATLVALRNDRYLVVSARGHFRGSPGVEDEIVFVAETAEGQLMFTPKEFAAKYDWRNDPDKVRLSR